MDYTKTIRLSWRRKFKPIDLLSEHFTLGHRIELGKVMQSKTPVELMRGCMQTLHDMQTKPRDIVKLYNYLQNIIKQLEQWNKIEQSLDYEATPEEKQAGYDSIYKAVKEFATIDSIALRMHLSHDEVLQLPYNTVYLMLRKDIEQAKYEKRLHKVHERKHK